jgi:hypothetical protein
MLACGEGRQLLHHHDAFEPLLVGVQTLAQSQANHLTQVSVVA